jgi:hypothetical protein
MGVGMLLLKCVRIYESYITPGKAKTLPVLWKAATYNNKFFILHYLTEVTGGCAFFACLQMRSTSGCHSVLH